MVVIVERAQIGARVHNLKGVDVSINVKNER